MSVLSSPVRPYACAALAVLCALLSAPGAALANGMEIGFDAGSAVPLQSQNIQLVSENVTIFFGGDLPGKTVCEYTLRNLTSQAQTIQMGFLVGSKYSRDPRSYADVYRAAGVRVIRWGDTLTSGDLLVRMEEMDSIRWKDIVPFPSDSIPVWEVRFGPSEVVDLEISYETGWTGGCNEGHCRFDITYYARAASLWAGSVERATIRFRLDRLAALLMACHPNPTSCLQLSATPASFTRFPWGFSWEMRDWEPAEDFNVSVEWTEPK